MNHKVIFPCASWRKLPQASMSPGWYLFLGSAITVCLSQRCISASVNEDVPIREGIAANFYVRSVTICWTPPIDTIRSHPLVISTNQIVSNRTSCPQKRFQARPSSAVLLYLGHSAPSDTSKSLIKAAAKKSSCKED